MPNMGDWAVCELKNGAVHQFIRIAAIRFFVDERDRSWLENGTVEPLQLFPFLRYFPEGKLEEALKGGQEWIYEVYAFKMNAADLDAGMDTALLRFDHVESAFDSYESLMSFLDATFQASAQDFDKDWNTNWEATF